MLKYIPGFAFILAIGIHAQFIQSRITVNGKEVVSAVAIAIILGVLACNLIGIPDSCKLGTGFAVKRLPRIGIALMGAQLSVGQVLDTGASSFADRCNLHRAGNHRGSLCQYSHGDV